MSGPSPRTHLYLLGAVLVIGFIGFLAVKEIATPASWNYEDWYREDSLKDIASLPVVYGGNLSCQTCHADENEEIVEFKHKTLSCESCHGPLIDHVQDGKKTAAAKVDDSTTWQCLNCHSKLVNRPPDFPQFSVARIEEHEEVAREVLCLACHNPHDPAP